MLKEIHLFVNIIWKKTSIIYILNHHWSHIKSQLEMERKNWGKEKRKIGSNYSHAVKKGRKLSK